MANLSYRKPGVYLEESPLNNPSTDVGSAIAAGMFVGVSQKGPINEPVRIESWSDFNTIYGGFSSTTGNPIAITTQNTKVYVAPDISGTSTTSLLNQTSTSPAQKGDLAFVNSYKNTFARFYQYQTADTDPGKTAGHKIYVYDGFTWVDTGYSYNSYSPLFVNANHATITSVRDDVIGGGTIPNVQIVFSKGSTYSAPSGTFAYGDIHLFFDTDDSKFYFYVYGSAGSRFATAAGTSPTAIIGQYVGSVTPLSSNPSVALPAGWNNLTSASQLALDTSYKRTGVLNRLYGLFTHSASTAGTYEPYIDLYDPPGSVGVYDIWAGFSPTVGYSAPVVSSVTAFSYLPYAVYSFFQNGGRTAWVVRSTSSAAGSGTSASVTYTDGIVSPTAAFTVSSKGPGAWANSYTNGLSVLITSIPKATLGAAEDVLTLRVFNEQQEVERFQNLSIKGTVPGTRRLDVVINDAYAGSQFIKITDVNTAIVAAVDSEIDTPRGLAGGTDPTLPSASDLLTSARTAATKVEGPLLLNIVAYTTDRSTPSTITQAAVRSSDFPDRTDIFIIQDNARRRAPNESSQLYRGQLSELRSVQTDSRVAAYTPWIVVPDPTVSGGTITIPPGGAVMGTYARIDSTVGVFRAPAGLIASLSNAIGVDVKFNDTELGALNHEHINVIRPTAGAGICIMGARTRKQFGADRYVSVRRMLIYISEVMKSATEFAVFENNDQRLWSRLTGTADRLLRPLWEAGGLKGSNVTEAYYINCDGAVNNPQVVASGEVRMEIGVALEIPAEFVIIKVSQFDSGTFTAEIQPA